ncbi:Jerky -like protein-like [Trichinella patagoniensis]|uniref:Jerky-like protein-like n=1 Tax=Trichinella patagoniensis TaxID=990121 RepID=A0A0V0ZIG5_9BILA|nr:Jerky -like protein-like [Trichinella patagoniensis]
MSTTRKRKVLSLEQKLEVCRLVEKGESFRKIAESFGVLFLPPNASSLVQPMDQTVIQCLKKRYRKQLLRKIVLSEADGGDLVSQLKSISLKNCCYMIAQAWDSFSGHTLGASWKKFLGYNEECDEGEQWLADDDTPLFETLTDEERNGMVPLGLNFVPIRSHFSFIGRCPRYFIIGR